MPKTTRSELEAASETRSPKVESPYMYTSDAEYAQELREADQRDAEWAEFCTRFEAHLRSERSFGDLIKQDFKDFIKQDIKQEFDRD